ncbi:odorant receptor 4-like [Halyomorpha halys]|uniref:odorant receptor 4-like n=1 Tax=Halyomorpha halys TaxID=286706 RepID=UPI0034D2402A|nr:Odorant receptor 95 [Halyomorpha halys]
MDAPKFVDHYRSLLRGLRRVGLATPWIEKPTLLSRVPFLLYDGLLVAIVVYMLCCYGYSITTITIPFQELCGLGVSTSNFICALLVTFYQAHYSQDLKRITDNMDRIAERILASDLRGADHFLQLYKRTSKLMAILTDYSIFFSFTLPIVYCFPVPVMDWMEGHYRSRHPVRIANPFNDKIPGVYELIAIVVACSIAFSTSKKAAMDCLFVTFFSIQSDFLKYLSVAMSELQKELRDEDSPLTRNKLITWFRLHQDIIRNTNDLIETISPVIITYYMTTIGIVVCGAFVQSMKENELFIQSISIGGYIMITLIYYFLLSNTADELTTEAQKLAFVVYSTPWYDMKKRNADMVQLVVTISTRPIEVTAYMAPTFLLNRETYAKFLVGAISAFITLCQMKFLYDDS